jgi:hypothetical protein
MTTNTAIAIILENHDVDVDDPVPNSDQTAFEYLEAHILGALDHILDTEPVCLNCDDDGCKFCDTV